LFDIHFKLINPKLLLAKSPANWRDFFYVIQNPQQTEKESHSGWGISQSLCSIEM